MGTIAVRPGSASAHAGGCPEHWRRRLLRRACRSSATGPGTGDGRVPHRPQIGAKHLVPRPDRAVVKPICSRAASRRVPCATRGRPEPTGRRTEGLRTRCRRPRPWFTGVKVSEKTLRCHDMRLVNLRARCFRCVRTVMIALWRAQKQQCPTVYRRAFRDATLGDIVASHGGDACRHYRTGRGECLGETSR